MRKIGSGETPRGGKGVYSNSGRFSHIRSQNYLDNGFSRDGLVYINDDQADQLKNVDVLADDVLLNITGDSVARCGQVDPGVLPARVNQHVAIIRTNEEILNSRFLRYVLNSQAMQLFMLGLASSGATSNAHTKVMIDKQRGQYVR